MLGPDHFSSDMTTHNCCIVHKQGRGHEVRLSVPLCLREANILVPPHADGAEVHAHSGSPKYDQQANELPRHQ